MKTMQENNKYILQYTLFFGLILMVNSLSLNAQSCSVSLKVNGISPENGMLDLCEGVAIRGTALDYDFPINATETSLEYLVQYQDGETTEGFLNLNEDSITWDIIPPSPNVTFTVFVTLEYTIENEQGVVTGSCMSDPITVNQIPTPSFELETSSDTLGCDGEGVLISVSNLENPGGPIIWSGEGDIAEDELSMLVFNAGTYSVTIGAEGCNETASETLIGAAPPVVDLELPAGTQLQPCSDPILVDASASDNSLDGTNTGLIFSWQLDGVVLPNCSGANCSFAEAGTYTLLITNAQGCTDEASFTITGTNTPSAAIAVNNSVVQNNLPATIEFAVSPETIPTEAINWTLDADATENVDLSLSEIPTNGNGTSISFTPALENKLMDGRITYTISVTEGACEAIQQQLSITIASDGIRIPEIITPNGDGKNDELLISLPFGENSIDYQLSIFSRAGELVYQGTLDQNWTGRGCPDGVYFYILEKSNGAIDPMKGAISVIGQKQ